MEAHAFGLADMGLIAAAFLIGGFVKGVIGIALPMLAMAILTTKVSVPPCRLAGGPANSHRQYLSGILVPKL